MNDRRVELEDRRVDPEDSLESSLREQRWFAALSAAKALQAECEVLLQVRDMADAEWRAARVRLQSVESLRDALSEGLNCSVADVRIPMTDLAERAEVVESCEVSASAA